MSWNIPLILFDWEIIENWFIDDIVIDYIEFETQMSHELGKLSK